MVSATLATAGDNFDYFMQQTGIRAEQALTVESPFDYAHQGLLWVPETLPDPKSPDLMSQLLQKPDLRAVIRRCFGGGESSGRGTQLPVGRASLPERLAAFSSSFFSPPIKIVLGHFFPVICWKTPVLTKYCIIIRWCACLLIHII